MKVYYRDDLITLYHGDAREYGGGALVVTDPPYNVGYHYGTYSDDMGWDEYLDLMAGTLRAPSVVIHYPEASFAIAQRLGQVPRKVVAWVYNANTPRQWRTVTWFGVDADLSQVKQPYKNPTDKRVAALIAAGKERTSYDWWHIDQVKNVSGEKTEHPCQVPLDLMKRVLLMTPGDVIVDPFAGSGTTLRAAKDLGRRAVGIEMDERYCEVIATRLSQETLGFGGQTVLEVAGDREPLVGEASANAEPSYDLGLIEPGQGEGVARDTQPVTDRQARADKPLPVAVLSHESAV